MLARQGPWSNMPISNADQNLSSSVRPPRPSQGEKCTVEGPAVSVNLLGKVKRRRLDGGHPSRQPSTLSPDPTYHDLGGDIENVLPRSDQNVNIVVSAHILGADGYRDAHVLRQHTSADMTIKHNADEALFEVISNDEKQQSYTQAFHRVRSELSHHQLLNQSEGHHRSYFRSVRRRVDNHVRKFRLMNLRYY